MAAGESYTGAVDLRRRTASGSTASPPASTPTCAPARHHPRRPRPVVLQHLGGRLLRPRSRPADRARPARRGGRRGAATCSTTAGSATAATTRPGWATGTSTRGVWPDGLHPLVDARARARHGVRAVGRARDDQPRLRPRAGPPRLDPRHGRSPAAAVAAPAGAEPRPPRRVRPHPGAAGRAARASTRSPTSSGTTTATWSTPVPVLRGRPACTPRPSRSTGCWTSCATGIPASRSSRARRAVCRVDLGDPASAPTGSGAATCIDPLERQQIQRWTAQLLPPELVRQPRRRAAGAHHRPHARPGLRGLRQGRAVDLRVEPHVVQRAGHDRQQHGADLGAVRGLAGEVVALVGGQSPDDEPDDEDHRADSHAAPPEAGCPVTRTSGGNRSAGDDHPHA